MVGAPIPLLRQKNIGGIMILKQQRYLTPFQEQRTLHVYAPDTLKVDKPICVLYMFDGHNLFYDEDATYNKSWGFKQYLDKSNLNLYVVGIECNHKDNRRLCEFSPYSFCDDTFGNVNGQGKQMLEWMVKELKPWFEQTFKIKTKKEHTFIGGSSMGGLMALYGGAKYARIFSKAICISPFYTHLYKRLYQELETINSLRNSQFYISWGQHEFETQNELAIGSERNLRIANLLTSKNAKVFTHCFENGHHCEASWEKEIPTFMKELEIEKR